MFNIGTIVLKEDKRKAKIIAHDLNCSEGKIYEIEYLDNGKFGWAKEHEVSPLITDEKQIILCPEGYIVKTNTKYYKYLFTNQIDTDIFPKKIVDHWIDWATGATHESL